MEAIRCGYNVVLMPLPTKDNPTGFEAPPGFRLISVTPLPKSPIIGEPPMMLCAFECVISARVPSSDKVAPKDIRDGIRGQA